MMNGFVTEYMTLNEVKDLLAQISYTDLINISNNLEISEKGELVES
jgi:hypothetical protein